MGLNRCSISPVNGGKVAESQPAANLAVKAAQSLEMRPNVADEAARGAVFSIFWRQK
jgi:hypothetical protein